MIYDVIDFNKIYSSLRSEWHINIFIWINFPNENLNSLITKCLKIYIV